MCFAPQRRAIFQHFNFKKCSEPLSFLAFSLQNVLLATPACNFFNFKKWSENVVFSTFSLENVLLATAACNFSTAQLQKVVREWCFLHFHLKMCFSPQRRAIFQHLNFKKWSEADVFCTFSLQNVLLATAACHFSTSQLQKVV